MRIAFAFILSPAIGILAYTLYSFIPLLSGLSVDDALQGVSLALGFLIPVYILTLLISTPIFAALRYWSTVSFWRSIAAALVIVLLDSILLKSFSGNIDNLFDARNFVAALVGGVAYGSIFWVIATWTSNRSNRGHS